MDQQQLREERPNHKTEDTYFVDTDGRVWILFGATADCILAQLCYYEDGTLTHTALRQFPYDRFLNWCNHSDIIDYNGEATVAIDAAIEECPVCRHREESDGYGGNDCPNCYANDQIVCMIERDATTLDLDIIDL